jgi:hypothetical protein
MKSLGVRLTMWYAMAATSTLVCLFLLGYEQLRGHLIHGLDMLNAAEFEQTRARLGDDYRAPNGRAIPDVPHRHRYTAEAPGVGQLRVAEFVMPGLQGSAGAPSPAPALA